MTAWITALSIVNAIIGITIWVLKLVMNSQKMSIIMTTV